MNRPSGIMCTGQKWRQEHQLAYVRMSNQTRDEASVQLIKWPPLCCHIDDHMGSNSGSSRSNFHFVLIPWLAQGHILPMIDIAGLLAEHGATVTVVTTPANASRIRSSIDRVAESGLAVRLLSLRFPSAEAGLPEGCESVDTISSGDSIVDFFNACKLLKYPLEEHLRGCSLAPSCIIAGSHHAWADEVAHDLGVPRLVFRGYSCFSLVIVEQLHLHKTHELVPSMTQPFVLDGLPHRIEIRRCQLPRHIERAHRFSGMFNEIRDSELSSDGIIVNSFDELETGYRECLTKITAKKVFDIGPVSLFNQTEQAMAARGEKASVDAEQCMRWLDTKPPKSVLYVSFGSMGSFTPRQMTELGAGLLASRRPFVWVIKSGKKWPGEMEAWLAERSVDGNPDCLMIKGWAPQVAILSHPSVGGFVTHCGWNSALEGVCGGVPMITWPLFAEQFLNEKLLVEVLGIGVSLGVEKPSEWGKLVEEDEEVAVTRDELAKAVERLVEGEEAKERRRRAEELRERARKAMEHGGSSYLSMEQLIQHAANRGK